MIHNEIVLHGQNLSVFIGCHLDIQKEWRSFAGVLHVLLIVVFKINRAIGGHAGYAKQCFHGGAEFIAKGTAGRVLNQAQLLGGQAQTWGDHEQVQVKADAL